MAVWKGRAGRAGVGGGHLGSGPHAPGRVGSPALPVPQALGPTCPIRLGGTQGRLQLHRRLLPGLSVPFMERVPVSSFSMLPLTYR